MPAEQRGRVVEAVLVLVTCYSSDNSLVGGLAKVLTTGSSSRGLARSTPVGEEEKKWRGDYGLLGLSWVLSHHFGLVSNMSMWLIFKVNKVTLTN